MRNFFLCVVIEEEPWKLSSMHGEEEPKASFYLRIERLLLNAFTLVEQQFNLRF